MTVFKLELRQGRVALAVWAGVLALLLAVCVVVFGELEGQLGAFESAMDQMGDFSQALGMTSQVFTNFTAYFAVEAGSLLGLGGAFFAALLGAGAMGREEKSRTAEFLLTHPVTRAGVVGQKLLALVVEIVALNAAVLGVALLVTWGTGQRLEPRVLLCLLVAFILLQLEIAALSLALTSLTRRGGTGLCLGLAAVAYFLNLLAALTEPLRFLRYVTPFGYADGAAIAASGSLSMPHLAAGLAITAAATALAFWRYGRKDIT